MPPEHVKTGKGKVYPSSVDIPQIALQSQLTRARCEVETLRGFKTENVAKELTIRDLTRKVKALESKLKSTENELNEVLISSEENKKLSDVGLISATEVERLTMLMQNQNQNNNKPSTPNTSERKHPQESTSFDTGAIKKQQKHHHSNQTNQPRHHSINNHNLNNNDLSISSRLSSAPEESLMHEDMISTTSTSLQQQIEALKNELDEYKIAQMKNLAEISHLKAHESERRKELAFEASEMAKIKQELAVSCRANADFEAQVEKLNEELEIYRNLPDASDQSLVSKSPSEYAEMVDIVPPLERTESPSRASRSRPGSRDGIGSGSSSLNSSHPTSSNNKHVNNNQHETEADKQIDKDKSGAGGGGSSMGALWGRMRTPRSSVSTPRSVSDSSREHALAIEEKELEINKLRKVVAVGQKEVSKLQSQITKLKAENKKLKATSSSHHHNQHHTKKQFSGSIDEVSPSSSTEVLVSDAVNTTEAEPSQVADSSSSTSSSSTPLAAANNDDGNKGVENSSSSPSSSSPVSDLSQKKDNVDKTGSPLVVDGQSGVNKGDQANDEQPTSSSSSPSPEKKDSSDGKANKDQVEFCDDTGREEDSDEATSKMEDEEEKKEAELIAKYNLDQDEFNRIQFEFNDHMVKGLNKKDFMEAVNKLLVKGATGGSGGSGGKQEPPKKKDLMKAFDIADSDNSGVVDLGEFVRLYHMVKMGEVKGLGGGGMFSFFKKKKK